MRKIHSLNKIENDCIVIFSAKHCAPCGPVKRAINNVATVPVYLVDVDDDEKLAISEGVMGLPTVRYYKGGLVIDEWSGSKTDRKITKEICGLYKE